MVRVARVHVESIAAELGVVPGAELISVNGRELGDFLDWEFLTAEDTLEVEARLPNGDEVVYDIERLEGVPLGVELEPPSVRRCANSCEFCFIEGLPKGLRKNLYIRDDDYRLSFAYGNFATLSNLKEKDEQRIVEYRLSPLYVSVHATPWEARKLLLNNPRVPDIKEQLWRLVECGIQFHGQMVVVPGLNDGDVLEQTLRDLWEFGDACLSVALVPVGLTQFSHLFTGRSMDRVSASSLVDVTERWASQAERERSFPWVYGSDELYLLAERELPAFEHYGDFPQIENGVGALPMLRHRVESGLERLPRLDGKRVVVVTGKSMAPHMPAMLEQIAQVTGASFDLRPTTNSLFGPTVTTAGLLVGADVERALSDSVGADLALIPAECINEDGIFLDDVEFAALRDRMPIPVFPSYDFVDVLERHDELASAIAGGRA